MRNKITLLLIIGLTMSQFVFSQTKFSYGAEIGINSSGTPYWNNYTIPDQNDKVKEANMPVISPVFGLWTKINFGKHFFTNISVQYLRVGNKYHYHRDGNDLFHHETYTDDEWENQTFQEISIPLTIGYDFIIKNVKANIFLGYKENYFTKASYYNKRVFVEGNHPPNIDVQQLNPFNKTQFTLTAKKWDSGWLIGFGVDLSKKLKLDLSFSTNDGIFYGNSFGWEGFYYYYGNGDIALTVKYCIK
jgi:hypothetical protein